VGALLEWRYKATGRPIKMPIPNVTNIAAIPAQILQRITINIAPAIEFPSENRVKEFICPTLSQIRQATF
jgi:hypothetical protein